MPKIPGVNHLRAINAFEKAGFRVVAPRQAHCNERRHAFHHDSTTQSGERDHNGWNLKDANLAITRFKAALIIGTRRHDPGGRWGDLVKPGLSGAEGGASPNELELPFNFSRIISRL